VKTPIADENNDITWLRLSQIWRSATQHLALRPRLALWQTYILESSLLLQHRFGQQQGTIELNNSQKNQWFILVFTKVLLNALNAHVDIKLDLDEHIEHVLYRHRLDRHEAAVPIVHDEVAAQLFAR